MQQSRPVLKCEPMRRNSEGPRPCSNKLLEYKADGCLPDPTPHVFPEWGLLTALLEAIRVVT